MNKISTKTIIKVVIKKVNEKTNTLISKFVNRSHIKKADKKYLNTNEPKTSLNSLFQSFLYE